RRKACLTASSSAPLQSVPEHKSFRPPVSPLQAVGAARSYYGAMTMRDGVLVIAVTLFGVGCSATTRPPAAPPQPGAQTVDTVVERAQHLPGLIEHRHYASRPEQLEKYAAALWPQIKGELAMPNVVDENGARSPREWDGCPAEANQLINLGETAFQNHDYGAAAEKYQQALDRAPRCFVAIMYLGDCAWQRHDAAAALALFERALALDPHVF